MKNVLKHLQVNFQERECLDGLGIDETTKLSCIFEEDATNEMNWVEFRKLDMLREK